MKKWNGIIRLVLVSGCLLGFTTAHLHAQGTKLWTESSYDEMEHGVSSGVAIRSDGQLEPGPAASLLYQTGGNYIWSIAADSSGNAYAGLGSTGAGGAVVVKIEPNGKAAHVFEGKELAVQSVRLGSDGHVYAVTSPDGKVYRLGNTPAEATVVFDPSQTSEKPKYLWDVVQGGNDLYVAAGAPAVVYRVPLTGGKPEVAFRTADQHIRCLLLQPDGTLWAGSDGSGVIYRFDTKAANAKPFAVYAAPKKEITSLAADSTGNIYAAGVGEKTANGTTTAALPPLPVTGSVGVTITFSQPGSANAASTNSLIPDGSDVYRIAPDGSPETLVSLKDDVVYALTVHGNQLLASTGNRGRIYRLDTHQPGRFTDLAHLDASQGMAFAPIPGALLVATSNSGKVYRVEDHPDAHSTYTSDVFDATVFSHWGHVEVLPGWEGAGFDLFVRSGNVPSPLMGWSDWIQVKNGEAAIPSGRYVQWRADLKSQGVLQSVGLNYLEKNIAPSVDQIVVQLGARVPAAAQAQNNAVQIAFPTPSSTTPTMTFTQDPNTQPLQAQKDKSAITARWAAHDDNGDDLMFSVWYRGSGEKNWLLLKRRISEHYYSFDSSRLPDGLYELKVIASDAPDHSSNDTLTAERISDQFVVDTTPPVPGALSATFVPASGSTAAHIHATFEAKDATSPIAHAEYSVDAGPWQYLEPVDHVSDSLQERYDFNASIPSAPMNEQIADPQEHVIAIRVYDRYDNEVTAKAVVH